MKHGSLKSLVAKDVNLSGDKGARSAQVLVDTGASRSMVRGDLASALGTPSKLARPVVLTLGDNRSISITDAVTLSVEIGGKKLTDSFLVFESLIEDVILGVATMRKYGLKIDLESQAIYAEMKEETSMQEFIKRLLAAIGITSVKDDVSEDDAIKLVKDKVAPEEPAMSAALLALLDLQPGASEAQVRGALLALKHPGNVVSQAEHEALKNKLASLEIDAAVLAAVNDGKLTPAEKDGWLKDLKEGKERIETFAAFTARRGKIVPLDIKLPGKKESLAAASEDRVEMLIGEKIAQAKAGSQELSFRDAAVALAREQPELFAAVR